MCVQKKKSKNNQEIYHVSIKIRKIVPPASHVAIGTVSLTSRAPMASPPNAFIF